MAIKYKANVTIARDDYRVNITLIQYDTDADWPDFPDGDKTGESFTLALGTSGTVSAVKARMNALLPAFKTEITARDAENLTASQVQSYIDEYLEEHPDLG